MKPRIIVLLGAGASVDAGVPSTNDLTEFLLNSEIQAILPTHAEFRSKSKSGFTGPLRLEIPVCRAVHSGLRSSFKYPNFEHILAALEELQAISSSQIGFEVSDDLAHVLSPFVSIDSRYNALNQPGLMAFARHEIIDLLALHIHEKLFLNSGARQPTNEFIRELEKSFSLSVYSLNYDDLIDDSTVFYDGFEPGQSSYKRFDRRKYLQMCQDEDLNRLMHLHGSIRFGYPNDNYHDDPSELVKYDVADDAIGTFDGRSNEIFDRGTVISTAPIISGFHKVAKLTHSPIPYGYYYHSFLSELMSTNRLLVIGYGAGDEHINGWINEHVVIHGSNRKSGYISLCLPNQQRNSVKTLMSLLAGTRSYNDSLVYYDSKQQTPEFLVQGNLAICTAGFPLLSPKTLDALIQFLS